LQAKRQFRAEIFYQIRMTNEHDFPSPLTRVSPARFFASNPFQKMAVLSLRTPAAPFLTDIETQIYQKHKNAENSASQQISPYRLLTQKPKFQLTPEKS